MRDFAPWTQESMEEVFLEEMREAEKWFLQNLEGLQGGTTTELPPLTTAPPPVISSDQAKAETPARRYIRAVSLKQQEQLLWLLTVLVCCCLVPFSWKVGSWLWRIALAKDKF